MFPCNMYFELQLVILMQYSLVGSKPQLKMFIGLCWMFSLEWKREYFICKHQFFLLFQLRPGDISHAHLVSKAIIIEDDNESDIAWLFCELWLCVLNAAPFENS